MPAARNSDCPFWRGPPRTLRLVRAPLTSQTVAAMTAKIAGNSDCLFSITAPPKSSDVTYCHQLSPVSWALRQHRVFPIRVAGSHPPVTAQSLPEPTREPGRDHRSRGRVRSYRGTGSRRRSVCKDAGSSSLDRHRGSRGTCSDRARGRGTGVLARLNRVGSTVASVGGQRLQTLEYFLPCIPRPTAATLRPAEERNAIWQVYRSMVNRPIPRSSLSLTGDVSP